MADQADLRTVHVATDSDVLIRVLNEHGPAAGWWALPLTGEAEPGALVIVDLDKADAVLKALEGFGGPVLVLGDGDTSHESFARPVRLGALLARIGAHLAQLAGGDTARLGPYEFVPAEQLLRGADAVIRLTELESRLLGFLAAAGGALIEREQLLADVWGYNEGLDTHTVETHIWRLRQKIETEDPETRFLVTEAGGYRLLIAGLGQAG
jgi:hypothetical protein